MTYRYDETDLRNGMKDTNGYVGLDATVFVSDGGYFRGVVAEHGTLIIRGGRAEVIIGAYGRVITHGGVLEAVVEQDGELIINEGMAYVKEQGGYVRATANSHVTFEPSIIVGATFTRYTSIHRNTLALRCKIRPTAIVTVHRDGVFCGEDNCLVPIGGTLVCGGVVHHAYVARTGKLNCSESQDVHHIVLRGGSMSLDKAHNARSIIIDDGLLEVKPWSTVNNVSLERFGRIMLYQHAKATFRKELGDVIRHNAE